MFVETIGLGYSMFFTLDVALFKILKIDVQMQMVQ